MYLDMSTGVPVCACERGCMYARVCSNASIMCLCVLGSVPAWEKFVGRVHVEALANEEVRSVWGVSHLIIVPGYAVTHARAFVDGYMQYGYLIRYVGASMRLWQTLRQYPHLAAIPGFDFLHVQSAHLSRVQSAHFPNT